MLDSWWSDEAARGLVAKGDDEANAAMTRSARLLGVQGSTFVRP